MHEPLLDIRHLTIVARNRAGWGRTVETPIVDDVSFTLERGRVIGLIGESGAGKSTIGLAALGRQRPGLHVAGGEIRLAGRNLVGLAPAALRRLRGESVAYVAQSAAAAFNPAYPLLAQVIETTVRHGRATRAQAEARARDLFRLLALPEPERFGDRYPHQASGGQLQRAMTAMALCAEPALVVFDEPTTALDVTTQIEVLAAIRAAIEDTGTAAIYITHDLALIAQIADDILVLRGGRTVEAGPREAIIERPREDYTRRLLAARRTDGPASIGEPAPVLEIAWLDAGYGNTPILHGIDLTVERGRTLAVVGESGSGKSTLARVVTGLLPPGAGTMHFDGRPLAGSLRQRTKDELRRIQIVNQIPDLALNPRQSVGEIVGRPLTFYFGLRGAERRRRVEALCDSIELPASLLARYPAELSGGQKQRVCIARALAAEPELIVCDEPTSALDPLVAEGVLKLLARLQAERGVSYLFITHDLATVDAIAHSVAVMREGRILRSGPRQTVLSPPFDPYTQALLASVPQMRIGWLDGVLAGRSLGGVKVQS
ncbi:ABC transporter ATP-binding protein [Aureimonas sp. AU12]|uniref:ABC transporter ATP-binding protein n=1 Tax=Aureimonas sp. AU12 TaxID=1638161 RepID=UPI000785331D|nr:ABC transporter ATP-binding protein [Aureimonas sp. AU12]